MCETAGLVNKSLERHTNAYIDVDGQAVITVLKSIEFKSEYGQNQCRTVASRVYMPKDLA